jgi:uncharacterized Zn finger protein
MSEQHERVAAVCPSCSPDAETVHEVLKPGGQATVRCTECSHVHKVSIEREREVPLDVVVSQDGESFPATVDAPAEEQIAVGEEFIVDTEEAILLARITSIDVGGDRRVDEATVEDAETVWTRAVDNVSVNVTVHPNDGRRDDSKSVKLQVPGDYEFTVGETEEFGDEEFTIEGIAVRRDAVGYEHDKLDFEGDVVHAKDVKRVYARDETTTAWSAW